MNNKLKQGIKHMYDAPLPKQKQEFLRNFNYPKTRWRDFLCSQLGYIRKHTWIVSIVLFLAIQLLGNLSKLDNRLALWVVSALMPFLTLITVTEVARSAVFGMAEIEMSSRYSLRCILLARMGILGTGNLVLLFLILPVLSGKSGLELIKTGVFLLVPYLLTCFLSFALVNRFRTGEIYFYCAGTAVLVSAAEILFNSIWSYLYQQRYFPAWMIVVALLLAVSYREIQKFMKNTEELTWNLYLTD